MVGKFMAKVIAEIQDWADVKLRRLCGRITPDQRVVVIHDRRSHLQHRQK